MIKLGVIGLGTIFRIQVWALMLLPETYQVTAVCDASKKKRAAFRREYLPGMPSAPEVYDSAEELLDDPEVGAVLIATPPHTHFELAAEALRRGKDVLLEKPAVTDPAALEELYRVSEMTGRLLHIAYHASFAADLEWFLENRGGTRIASIECGFYDPYMENGAVLPEKRTLGGSWLDSGVNALSVCARLVGLEDFRLREKHESRDGEGTVYAAQYVFAARGCTIVVGTGWDQGVNKKTTRLRFYGADALLLDHSGQRVIRQDGTELFSYEGHERLLTHYLGVFRDFERALAEGRPNRAATEQIHRLLLGGK